MLPPGLPSPIFAVESRTNPDVSSLQASEAEPSAINFSFQDDIDAFLGRLRFKKATLPDMTLVQRRKGFQFLLFENSAGFRLRKKPIVQPTIAERRGSTMPIPRPLPAGTIPWELSGPPTPSPPLPKPEITSRSNPASSGETSTFDPIPDRYRGSSQYVLSTMGGGPGPTARLEPAWSPEHAGGTTYALLPDDAATIRSVVASLTTATSNDENVRAPNAAAAVAPSVAPLTSPALPTPESLQCTQISSSTYTQPLTRSVGSMASRGSRVSTWVDSVDMHEDLLARTLSSSLDSLDLTEPIADDNTSAGLGHTFTVGSACSSDTDSRRDSHVSVNSQGLPKMSPQPVTWTVLTDPDEPWPAPCQRLGPISLPSSAMDRMAAFDLAEALADLSLKDKVQITSPLTRAVAQDEQVSPSLILWTTDPSFFADPPVLAVKPKGRVSKPVWQDELDWPDTWAELHEACKPRPRPAVKQWIPESKRPKSPLILSPPRPPPTKPIDIPARPWTCNSSVQSTLFEVSVGPQSPITISPKDSNPLSQSRGLAPTAPLSGWLFSRSPALVSTIPTCPQARNHGFAPSASRPCESFPARRKSRATRAITLQDEIMPLYKRLQDNAPSLEEALRAHLTAGHNTATKPFYERLDEGRMTLEQAIREHVASQLVPGPISEIRIPKGGFGEIWSWVGHVEKVRRVVSFFVVR